MEYVITFNTTNHAIKAEQCLLHQGLRVGVLPLPTQIKAGCGISLRVSPDEITQAKEILVINNINDFGLFMRSMDNGRYLYTDMTKK